MNVHINLHDHEVNRRNDAIPIGRSDRTPNSRMPTHTTSRLAAMTDD
jgi:hypothetical protein